MRPCEGAWSSAAILVIAASACSTHRTWGRRGSISLYISENVEVRSAKPTVDAAQQRVTIAWVGARTPEDKPRIERFTLVFFDDRDGDRQADDGEVFDTAECVEPSPCVIFGGLATARADALDRLFGRIRVKTAREEREVVWPLLRREDVP